MAKKLVRVSTYAKMNNKSLAWAYQQVNTGAVKCVVIDKVKFVEV